jgi:hypothetical protein
MIDDHLSGMTARNGLLIFVCSTCKEPPNFTFGAQASGELVYLMICPKCGLVLAEGGLAFIAQDNEQAQSLHSGLQERDRCKIGINATDHGPKWSQLEASKALL